MAILIQRSREHLAANGMTYAEHMRFAAWHGALCIRAGVLLMVHAVAPCWFQTAGKRLVRLLGESFDKEDQDAPSKTHVRAA